MDRGELLDAILNADPNPEYPSEFKARYDILECLSEQRGITTFLVRDHSGNNAVAKCYDKSLWTLSDNRAILNDLDCRGLPKQIDSFENDEVLVTVREYAEGIPLSRYAQENALTADEIIRICCELCDILSCLHHRREPVIHRDIKPQNIIIGPDGRVSLIDFDIARVYRAGHETDTVFFGTQAYAPPEQYGFSQTDARTDIYALGIVLRWLLTGSTKENRNIRIYRPLERIISRCTAFSPSSRYADVSQVKAALLAANPKSQAVRLGGILLCTLLLAGVLGYGGFRLYRYLTYTPFTKDAIPGYLSDEERIRDAVSYMKDRYRTSMFDESDEIATIGDLRRAMIDLYGLEPSYVTAINEDMPQESDAFFLPWGWDDGQTLNRDIAVYAAVKVHDPAIVADWSGLKDDNGYYPGVRVASAFAEKTGILTGANRPGDIQLGELALILANADRVFAAAKSE